MGRLPRNSFSSSCSASATHYSDVRAALGDVEKLVEDIKQRMENDDWKRVPIDGPPPICPSCRWGNTIPTGEPGRFKCRNCNHEFTFPNHVNCRCYHTPPEKLKKILEENPEWAVSANCGTPIGRTWLDNFFDDTEQYLKNERDKHVKKNH